ncbi:MAG: hypothetical protein LWY06_02480 [Firmicutes bacterium]|nr:hypothetical protein [Bacillota bacterium]
MIRKAGSLFVALSLFVLITITGVMAAPQPKLPPVPLREGESYIYKVSWQGEMAGYSKFFVEKKMSLAGENFFKLESISKLKMGVGEIDNLAFSANMTVKATDLMPTFFICLQKQAGVEFSVDCLLSNNLVAQQNHSPAGDSSSFQPYDGKKPPVILLNNLWGRYDTLVEHYWVLIKSRKTGKISAYDPILQHLGDIEIIEEGKDEVEYSGKKAKAWKIRMAGLNGETLFNIWVDENRNILKMQEPGGGLTFELASGDLLKEFESSKGVDMWKNRVANSNIFFPNPREIKTLDIEIDATGRGFVKPDMSYPGGSQEFKGEATANKIAGKFTIKTAAAEVAEPMAFPVKANLPEDIATQIKGEMGMEIDNDAIKNKGIELTWKSKNVWDAAMKVNSWINENIVMGVSLPSAKMTLANEQGNSESKSILAVTLCRSMGIPARLAGGVVFSSGNFVPHHWFEVYTGPKSGWVPLDPSTGEAGNLGATHIRFFSEGDIWGLKAKVINFSPRPPERLTFINREITWPVGEERTYTVKKDGKIIGRETGLVEEVSVLDDKETYKMNFTANLDMDGRKLDASAIYWITPEGLPVKYEKTLKSGDRQEKQTFFMKGKNLLQDVKGYRGDYSREIPFSKGAYFADPHFLCQWALIAGQFHEVSVGKMYNFYTFIPETLTVESVTATVKKFESVESGDKIFDCFRIETNKGIIFWIEKGNNRVIKVSFTVQNVDLELEKTSLKI